MCVCVCVYVCVCVCLLDIILIFPYFTGKTRTAFTRKTKGKKEKAPHYEETFSYVLGEGRKGACPVTPRASGICAHLVELGLRR